MYNLTPPECSNTNGYEYTDSSESRICPPFTGICSAYADLPKQLKNYKTELCRNYQKFGKCAYGDSCLFSHGEQELQEKQGLHPKYRTKPCREFTATGHCSYGIRCQFLHPQPISSYHELLRSNEVLNREKDHNNLDLDYLNFGNSRKLNVFTMIRGK